MGPTGSGVGKGNVKEAQHGAHCLLWTARLHVRKKGAGTQGRAKEWECTVTGLSGRADIDTERVAIGLVIKKNDTSVAANEAWPEGWPQCLSTDKKKERDLGMLLNTGNDEPVGPGWLIKFERRHVSNDRFATAQAAISLRGPPLGGRRGTMG